MTKKICLDIGNVLVKTNFQPFINKLSKSLNISSEEVNYFLNRTQKLHDVGFTRMADELRDHFHIKSSALIEELMEYWQDVITDISDMFDEINYLREKEHVEIALLSNIGLDHLEKIKIILHHYHWDEKNVIYHFSCHVGARKPNAIFFQSFLQQYPGWKNAAYIDDLQENLDMGQKFGLRPFRFALDEMCNNYNQKQWDDKWQEMTNHILLKH